MGLFVLSLVATVVMFMIMPRQTSFPPRIPARSRSTPKRPTAPPSTRWSSMQRQLADIAQRDPNIQAVVSSVGSGGAAHRHQYRQHAAQAQDRAASASCQRRRDHPGAAAQAAARVWASTPICRTRPSIRVGGQSVQIHLSICAAGHRPGRAAEDRGQADGRAVAHAPGFADVTTDMDFTSPSVECRRSTATRPPPMASRSRPSRPRWARPSAASRFPPSMPATRNIG